MMSIFQAVLLGILGGIGISDSRVFGIWMIDRPLILGPLVGLVLGDLRTGIVIGASLELVMMGVAGIGSATPPDTVSGTILAAAFAITSGLEISAAVALALPIAALGQLVGILIRTANAFFIHMADRAAEKGDYHGIGRALWGGAFLFFAGYFFLIFAGTLLGSNVIRIFVDKIPQSVINGFNVASGMLPALGIAILMQLLFDKKNTAFFFVGWAITALFGVNTVGAAVVGVAIACLIFRYTDCNRANAAVAGAGGLDERSDDLGGEL